jgi:hypothetical protein
MATSGLFAPGRALWSEFAAHGELQLLNGPLAVAILHLAEQGLYLCKYSGFVGCVGSLVPVHQVAQLVHNYYIYHILKMNNHVANFRRRWINGTNFGINKNQKYDDLYQLIHRPSGAFVSLLYKSYDNSIHVTYGLTPNKYQGKGIGTILRALATIFAIETRKRITQNGVENRPLKNLKTGVPISTYILRNKLGWSKNNRGTGGHPSVFRVGNNNSKVRKVLRNWKLPKAPAKSPTPPVTVRRSNRLRAAA